jgi:hypothetical protein
MAENFSWVLFHALVVAKVYDPDDPMKWRYEVIDGGHRLRAVFLREDITHVPCMIFDISTIEQCAQTFLNTNLLQTRVHTIQTYLSAIEAKDPRALKIQEILNDHGLRVVNGGRAGDTINCVGILDWCAAISEESLREALTWCVLQDWDRPIPYKILKGLFFLHHHSKPKYDVISTYGDYLAEYPLDHIVLTLNNFKSEFAETSASKWSEALTQLINRSRGMKGKRKLRAPSRIKPKKRKKKTNEQVQDNSRDRSKDRVPDQEQGLWVRGD